MFWKVVRLLSVRRMLLFAFYICNVFFFYLFVCFGLFFYIRVTIFYLNLENVYFELLSGVPI